MINIAIADDHTLFRQGLKFIIDQFDDMIVSIEASNGKELLDLLEKTRHLPEIILMDLNMPELNGTDATQIIKEKYPDIKVLILSMHNEDILVYDLLKKGALGYLFKDAEANEFEKALREIHEKGYYFNANVIRVLHANIREKEIQNPVVLNNKQEFSQQEISVLKLICSQYSNKEIASKLYLSIRTIEGYRQSLLAKTNTKNSIGLAIFAIRNGYFSIS